MTENPYADVPPIPSYAGNDRDRYEPPACPRCGARPEVNWVNVDTMGRRDRWFPSIGLCRTPACLDGKGNNYVPLGDVPGGP